jgi:hypothetical protein
MDCYKGSLSDAGVADCAERCFGFKGFSFSYAFSQDYTGCDYSGCSEGIVADIKSGNQSALCANLDLSCVYDCISELLLEAHCACDTGVLFDDSGDSFDFVGATYCCGSDTCKDAVRALYAATNDDVSAVTNDTNTAITELYDSECDAVVCFAPTSVPAASPTNSGGGRRLLGGRRFLGALEADAVGFLRRLTTSIAFVTFTVNGRLGLVLSDGVPALEYQTARLFQAALEAALQEFLAGGSLEADLEISCATSVSIATILVNHKREFPTLLPTPVPTPQPTPVSFFNRVREFITKAKTLLSSETYMACQNHFDCLYPPSVFFSRMLESK